MQAYSLDKVETLRTHLAQTRTLFEVRASDDGTPQWQQIDAGDNSAFHHRQAQFSAKSFFFAEREALFTFDGSQFVAVQASAAPQVLFGVSACDLLAVAYQDRFFADDAAYQRRRRATLLVGIDCLSPCQHGFCPSVDAGPAVRTHSADLILVPPNEAAASPWLVVASSDSGAAALQGLTLVSAPNDWQTQRERREHEVSASFADARHILDGIEQLNAGRIDAELWQDLGLRCLACSGCTSLCPTCSCYTRYERHSGDNTLVTERCWDSCLYDGFQREASGHNPSVSPGQRVERFWYHKFAHDFVDEFGRYGCVGCGRCEQTCPGVIGVHSVMQRLSASCKR